MPRKICHCAYTKDFTLSRNRRGPVSRHNGFLLQKPNIPAKLAQASRSRRRWYCRKFLRFYHGHPSWGCPRCQQCWWCLCSRYNHRGMTHLMQLTKEIFIFWLASGVPIIRQSRWRHPPSRFTQYDGHSQTERWLFATADLHFLSTRLPVCGSSWPRWGLDM